MDSELDEKDFIQKTKQPKTIWVFLILFLLVLLVLWGVGIWMRSPPKEQPSRFFQVTNREFSLFLWQNPEFATEEVLPHFQGRHVDPDLADFYVSTPAEVLFRFHVWNRILKQHSLAPQEISKEAFAEFLEQNPMWEPHYWREAPEGYPEKLPFDVKLAFQGWTNMTKQWSEIESAEAKDLDLFLKEHSQYQRPYWQNIVPGYLDTQIPSFFKIGYFNFTKPSS